MPPWQPGQSGNLSGRRPADYNLKHLAREHTAKALQTLVDIMTNAKATHTARVAAANSLLDRGFGKPVNEINAQISTRPVIDIDKLSPTDRAELQRFTEEWGPLWDRLALQAGTNGNGNSGAQ